MSALESSITLDDVFVVVGAKRVPLAPELAGYLALEIAEGAQEPAGDVDPRSVYIGEEGSVALVTRARARREGEDGGGGGDAEASVRAILGRLLEASGSQTPALGGVVRRRAGGGLGSLVEELEAALIPVNRAAGRRALARLAREVKRVTLGVGRNASLAPGEPAPKRGSSPSHGAVRDAPPPPVPAEPAPPPPVAERPVPSVDASDLPTVELHKDQLTAALSARSAPPPPVQPTPAPGTAKRGATDEVDHLLATFAVSSRGEQAQRNELKALVGLDPTPPPPGSNVAYDASPTPPPESGVESLLSLGSGSDPGPSVAAPAAPAAPHPLHHEGLASPPTAISPPLANEAYGVPRPASGPVSARRDAPRAVATAPSARKLAEISSFQTPRAPRTDRTLGVLALIVLGAGAAAIYVLKPAFFSGRSAPPAQGPPPPVTSAPAAAVAQASRCHASLLVNDAPANAEVLLRVGQAPVDVERMPVGARLEFVATAEGFAPKRAIVPSGATWDSGPDGKPRYEVAVQLDKSRARAGAIDSWPAGEPGSEVGGKGSPGTVHLVATPHGAEVWLLAGLGPEAHIEQLKCGGDVEVLIAGPTTLRKRLHVPESAFMALDGGDDRAATVSAK